MSTGKHPFRLTAAKTSTPRLAIAADVTVNGKHLGQITEAIVNVTAGS